MLLHICNSNKVPFPSAPHPSLIAHLDISKEKHAQLSAEIKARHERTNEQKKNNNMTDLTGK